MIAGLARAEAGHRGSPPEKEIVELATVRRLGQTPPDGAARSGPPGPRPGAAARPRPPQPPIAARHKPSLAGWDDHTLAATWIGHATVLLRIAGVTILTDPVMSNRVGVGLGVCTGGPRRLVAPALAVRELPRVDVILLSHAHFDHLDRPTLGRLPKGAHVVTAEHTRDLVADLGFRRISELRRGEWLTHGPLTIAAHPVAHWGARTFFDHHRGYNAYSIAGGGRRVLYGGDTAYHEGFREVGAAGDVDLAILGIGAYDPYVAAHATPGAGVGDGRPRARRADPADAPQHVPPRLGADARADGADAGGRGA
jgi:L-ascorbate metabolism protein UlaG (beta-lactamase superfamily)